MREVRIRREPSGWFTVEKVTLNEHGHAVGVKPSYHMNIASAICNTFYWIWNK